MTVVRIPPTLRGEVGGERQVEAAAAPSAKCSRTSRSGIPRSAPQLFENGSVVPFVNVYLGGEDVRTLDGTDTPVREGDTVILLPAMAGGSWILRRRLAGRAGLRPAP